MPLTLLAALQALARARGLRDPAHILAEQAARQPRRPRPLAWWLS